MDINLGYVDLSSVCRLCLSPEESLRDIFAIDECGKSSETTLVNKVRDVTSVQVSRVDGFPTHICEECCQLVDTAHTFKRKCLMSDLKLREHLSSSVDPHDKVVQEADTADSTLEHDFVSSKSVNTVKNEFAKRDCSEIPPGPPAYSLALDFNPIDVEVKVEIVEEENNVSHEGKSDNDVRTNSQSRTCKFICTHCSKGFHFRWSLKRHEILHKFKILECRYCKKTFHSVDGRSRHERIHTGQTPYHCQYCKKSYTSGTSFSAHVRKHTGEKPFQCSECKEKFSLLSSFSRHVVKHRGVKSFVCEICDASFWVGDDLRAHVNRKH